ncbi:MAG TPA: N-acetyltransferase [Candidatus Hydrogenedens sp.]|nr:N-acetyltransferase [Candidatus Hydrogenedens sp.]HOL18857.1 N-acetyltransferase [Candidatus Hydrogenedens sp.]HPP59755.1 N-acetyltransferase [Candidatus Hydrogenedens sp.]
MYKVRKPKLSEVPQLKALIDNAYNKGFVLPRTLEELYENVRDFYVFADEKGVAGCAALHIDTETLAEVRTLIVREDLQNQGIGTKLLNAVLEEAKDLNIPMVYVLTRNPEFFKKRGFKETTLDTLPYKIRKDCARCPKHNESCDEIPMVLTLKTNTNYK